MQTIAETITNHNLRSIKNRRSHQCAHPGWRPRRRSQRQLARDIADPIRQHHAAGDSHGTQPSEFTPHPETQTLVHQLLMFNETPTSAETRDPALSVYEADALLRFTRVAEQDDPACVECGRQLDVDDLAIILDPDPAGAIWCSTPCAETMVLCVERSSKGDANEPA